MGSILAYIKDKFATVFRAVDAIMRDQAVETVEYELRELEKLIDNYEHLRRHFLSDAARINLVMNNDRLSFSETYRIRHKLGQIGIAIDRVVVNKLTPGEPIDNIENEFKAQQLMRLPAATAGLTGYKVLKKFVQDNRKNFGQF